MAFETGTATSFLDLYTKLRDFLTTNAALVAAGENWTVLSGPASGALTYTDALMLQGPGTSGTDEILVSTLVSHNVGADYYNLGFAGYSSYNPALPLAAQPNRITERWMLLANSAMPYWFVANGRRFVVVARIGSTYESAYCGFILPYHLPTTWAYPHFIGACVDNSRGTWRYSTVSGYHSAFFNPGEGAAYIRMPDGTWNGISNLNQVGVESWLNVNNVSPWHQYFRLINNRQAVDGSMVLLPAELSITTPFPAALGALQGVWYVPGFGKVPEDTATIAGVTHILIPNINRTDLNNFMALALE